MATCNAEKNSRPVYCNTLNGKNREIYPFHKLILSHIALVCKCFANFALLGCAIGAVCAVAGLAEGGGAASLAGLIACLLGGWAAITLREVLA